MNANTIKTLEIQIERIKKQRQFALDVMKETSDTGSLSFLAGKVDGFDNAMKLIKEDIAFLAFLDDQEKEGDK